MTKERFDFLVEHGIMKAEDVDHVEWLINALIQSLYIPTLESHQKQRDQVRCVQFEIEPEPINWGDLKVVEVEKYDGIFNVIIDEASPNDCQTFCSYIQKYMASWGWNVIVETEW